MNLPTLSPRSNSPPTRAGAALPAAGCVSAGSVGVSTSTASTAYRTSRRPSHSTTRRGAAWLAGREQAPLVGVSSMGSGSPVGRSPSERRPSEAPAPSARECVIEEIGCSAGRLWGPKSVMGRSLGAPAQGDGPDWRWPDPVAGVQRARHTRRRRRLSWRPTMPRAIRTPPSPPVASIVDMQPSS